GPVEPSEILIAAVPGILLALCVASFLRRAFWLLEDSPDGSFAPHRGPAEPRPLQGAVRPPSPGVLQEAGDTNPQKDHEVNQPESESQDPEIPARDEPA